MKEEKPGTVIIQTAAHHGATIYSNVNNPQLLMETITTIQEEYKNSTRREQTGHVTPFSIGSELERIYDLKERGILTENEYSSLKYKIIKFGGND